MSKLDRPSRIRRFSLHKARNWAGENAPISRMIQGFLLDWAVPPGVSNDSRLPDASFGFVLRGFSSWLSSLLSVFFGRPASARVCRFVLFWFSDGSEWQNDRLRSGKFKTTIPNIGLISVISYLYVIPLYAYYLECRNLVPCALIDWLIKL